MPVERNKATVRRILEEVWNERNLDAVDEIFVADPVFYQLGYDDPLGVQGFKEFCSYVCTVFPDIHFDLKALIGEGDTVALHWTWRGTHQGTVHLAGTEVAPTGKEVRLEGIDMYRITEGKVAEIWTFMNDLAPALGFRYVRQPDDEE